ncbi:MAG: DUF732 domain-containing protein [Actinomycetota bacterium]|nr:DUF732 domain-containing protein [Actinomycetota bacterium]
MYKPAIAIGAALIGVSLALSPPAQADNSGFVSHLKALGFQQASDNLISTARSACYFLSLNRHPGQVTDRISRYLAVDADLARTFFAMSVNEYCPQYRDRVGG